MFKYFYKKRYFISMPKDFGIGLRTRQGFTLIELLVYISVIVIIATVIASFLPQLIKANTYAQTRGEVLHNVNNAMEIMAQEIRHSTSIYTTTSVFGSSPGQLSLETTRNAPAEESYTFVDFFVDDDRLHIKREYVPLSILTSKKVKIDNLTFTHLYSSSNNPAIRISLTAFYDSPSLEVQQQSQVTLTSTVSLRSY